MEETLKKKRRKFTEEFKSEAIELGNRLGASAAARELGLYESQIRGWKKALEVKSKPHKKSYADIERENKRLKKENGYLKEINKVLKKSTAIFCSDQLGDTR